MPTRPVRGLAGAPGLTAASGRRLTAPGPPYPPSLQASGLGQGSQAALIEDRGAAQCRPPPSDLLPSLPRPEDIPTDMAAGVQEERWQLREGSGRCQWASGSVKDSFESGALP